MCLKCKLRVVLSNFSLDVFSVTCGRSGVGSITSIDMRLDGTDWWHVDWVEISTDSETARFEVNHYFAAHETSQFFRNGLDTREYRDTTAAGLCEVLRCIALHVHVHRSYKIFY